MTPCYTTSWDLTHDHPNFSIAHPTVDPYGETYETWAQRWLQWAFGTPIPDNPIVESGCDNLVGRIWFMPHTYIGNRAKIHCTISDRTPVLLSAGGVLCDTSDGPASGSELRVCAINEFDSLSNFRVWVDGVRIQELEQWIFLTPVFSIRYPEDNLFGVVPGTYRAAAKAYMLMLRPLSPGRHTVIVHDEYQGEAARFTTFLKVVSRR